MTRPRDETPHVLREPAGVLPSESAPGGQVAPSTPPGPSALGRATVTVTGGAPGDQPKQPTPRGPAIAGVFPRLPEAAYHADPVPGGSLTSTGARRLLIAPAVYRWRQDHPGTETSQAFDLGSAVHTEVLGAGPPIQVIHADSWRTAAARAARDEARAAGFIPVLPDDARLVTAMTDAVLTHRDARPFLEQDGHPEVSVFARDPDTGVWLRARPDFLPHRRSGRTVIVDLKTAATADPRAFGRDAWAWHYEQQAAWYQTVVRAARGDDDTAFVFVVVEKTPPHLVSVIQLDPTAEAIGSDRNRIAIDTYARCTASGEWPGYAPGVHVTALPRWAEYDHDRLMEEAA